MATKYTKKEPPRTVEDAVADWTRRKTFRAARETWSVSLDLREADLSDDRIVWDTQLPDVPNVPVAVRGVYLGTYEVRRESDESWCATITLGRSRDDESRVVVVGVTIKAGEINSAAMPLHEIVRTCLSVGALSGTYTLTVGERSGIEFPFWSLNYSRDGRVYHPDEIAEMIGVGRRSSRYKDEQHVARTWQAMQEFAEIKAAARAEGRKPDKTQREYVSSKTGEPVSNIEKTMAIARRHYGKGSK